MSHQAISLNDWLMVIPWESLRRNVMSTISWKEFGYSGWPDEGGHHVVVGISEFVAFLLVNPSQKFTPPYVGLVQSRRFMLTQFLSDRMQLDKHKWSDIWIELTSSNNNIFQLESFWALLGIVYRRYLPLPSIGSIFLGMIILVDVTARIASNNPP